MRLSDVKPLFENRGELTTVTPDAIPAIVNRSMAPAGLVTPQWKMVANMPGYLAQSIRNIGAAVFNQYTNTPIDQIQVIANVNGQGPNDERELNALGKWVVDKGTPVTGSEIDFEGSIPGYKAQVKVFNAGDIQVMLVKDQMGSYAYAWPTSHAKGKPQAVAASPAALPAPERQAQAEPTRAVMPSSRQLVPVRRPRAPEPVKPATKQVTYKKPDDDDIFDWS